MITNGLSNKYAALKIRDLCFQPLVGSHISVLCYLLRYLLGNQYYLYI